MSMSSLSSFSDEDNFSSDEEIRIRRPRHFWDRKEPFNLYGEAEFKARYRLDKAIFMELLHLVGNALEPPTKRNSSISAQLQLLISLRFFATGSFQQLVGDDIAVHKSTVSRIVTKTTRQIARLKAQFIRMPTGNELRHVKLKFHQIRNFPNVIGAIDCTHVPIQSPGGAEAERYRNRKGYFSINVKAVCDASLKIRSIIARWPGSVHDSTIFNDSPLSAELEAGEYGSGYLLGDSGYACKKYLLTPLLNPQNEREQGYNTAQVATRNPIERCFGVLKRRFACLSKGLNVKLETTVASIVACAVLHNLCISLEDGLEELEEIEENEQPAIAPVNDANTAVRSALINTIF